MTLALSERARRIVEAGSFCHVTAATAAGPHVTPMVFALAGDRIWVTTARGSVKARTWAGDPRVAGVVRAGAASVAFGGSVVTYDLLDPGSWLRSLREAPLLSVAAARFTARNARFFAGYAVDAHQVPLAWTPPGRVFAELRPERFVVLEEDRPVAAVDARATTGWFDRFRATKAGAPPLDALPADVAAALGTSGPGVLAVAGGRGPAAIPVRWAVDGASLYAVGPESAFGDVVGPGVPAALGMDRPSTWRASHMIGAMARGDADLFAVERLSGGRASAERICALAAADPAGAALVRLRPGSLVWWRGWTSGTVGAALRPDARARSGTAP